jgi:hypothetical protein
MVLFINHVLFWLDGGLQSIFEHRAGDKQALQKTSDGEISYHTIQIDSYPSLISNIAYHHMH